MELRWWAFGMHMITRNRSWFGLVYRGIITINYRNEQ